MVQVAVAFGYRRIDVAQDSFNLGEVAEALAGQAGVRVSARLADYHLRAPAVLRGAAELAAALGRPPDILVAPRVPLRLCAFAWGAIGMYALGGRTTGAAATISL